MRTESRWKERRREKKGREESEKGRLEVREKSRKEKGKNGRM